MEIFQKLIALNTQFWWMGTIVGIGVLAYIIYRIVDLLQFQFVKSAPQPEDIKIPEEVYKAKRARKAARTWKGFSKNASSWLVQFAFIFMLVPFLVQFLSEKGFSYMVIYYVIMIGSFLVNMFMSKWFSIWTPAWPFVDRNFSREAVWRKENMMYQFWGVASWGIPAYYFWEHLEVQGWIGSVIMIVVSQLIQVFIFIWSIKKTAIPYLEYDGLSDQFKSNLKEYLQKNGMADSEVGVLVKSGMGPNAFATSMLGYKQVIMTEELIQGFQDPQNPDFTLKLGEDTIEAIIAHEVGHINHHHVEKGMAFGILMSSIVTIVTYNLFSADPSSYLLFSKETSQQIMLYWGQSIFNLLLMHPITFLMMGISRSNEYQADSYMLNTAGCKNGHDFFYQIRHVAPVRNHSAWHTCNMTHPPAHIREKRIRDWIKDNCGNQ